MHTVKANGVVAAMRVAQRQFQVSAIGEDGPVGGNLPQCAWAVAQERVWAGPRTDTATPATCLGPMSLKVALASLVCPERERVHRAAFDDTLLAECNVMKTVSRENVGLY